MKLKEYNEADTFDEGDILVKDGDLGTMKIPIEKVVKYLSETINPTVIFEDPEGYATNITEKMNEAEAIFEAAMNVEEHRFEKIYSVTTPTSQFTFNPTGYVYNSDDIFEVYVNGLKLDSSAYSNNNNVITIDAGVSGDGNPDIVEIVCTKQVAFDPDYYASIPAEMHKNVYRGKNLGTSVTSAQRTAISSGTFDDLFIGDYWVINGVTWLIADMDYFYECPGATSGSVLRTHHLVIVPLTRLYGVRMNATGTTEGGYNGSEMKTFGLDNAVTAIEAAFPNLVLTHREYFSTRNTGDVLSGSWYATKVDLMNEIMVFGSHILGIPTMQTICKQQLALFRLKPSLINESDSRRYWLRDIRSSSSFCHVNNYCAANYESADGSSGVRPYFCIGVTS